MKGSNCILLPLAASMVAAFVASAGATVVYEDNFDNDGLATNTGIGGGLFAYDRQGNPWLDNGVLDSNRLGNNDRGNAISINSFDLTGGFTLEVTYQIDNVATIDANRAIIGLIDENDVPATQTNTTYITDFLNRDLNMYGIGMNLTVQNGTQGFNFSNGTDLMGLSNAQSITTGTHTVSFTVDSDSNWSYSIDGAPATTGTLPEAFNFGTNYQFVTYMQDNHNHLKIHAVSLDVVSDPKVTSITSITSVGGGVWELKFEGEADTGYEFRSSPILDFSPGALVENLTDGVPAVGTIGGTNDSVLTTDGNGDATVRMTLTGPANFVRAQVPPPPPPLFSEDFETDNGGFTTMDHSADGTGSDWAHGDPDSSSEGGSVTTGNGGSTNCWGTDISNPGIYATGTDTSLISPVIDLTDVPDAVLSFAQAIDILNGDTLVVNVLDDTTDTVLQAAVHTSTPDADINAADWEVVSDVAITGGEPVRIEWRFTGNNDATYLGAYIDDVVVTVPGS